MFRTNKITFKVTNNEREELNRLMLEQTSNLSDLIRMALKSYYGLEDFDVSYLRTTSRVHESKWRLY